jgi:two-component system cell cycle sensor histidine kinase PleC
VRKSLLSRYSTDFGNLVSRRNNERALRAAAIDAAVANRAKSEFLANMSHELRTPLNAIIGFSDLIRHTQAGNETPTKTLEYADNIWSAGQHLLAIISDILDLSKIESRAIKLDLDVHAIQDTVRECIAMVQGRIEARSQTLTVHVDEKIAPLAYDKLRVKQILLNLLTNASKFTPEGGQITLAVGSERTYAIIAVIDTGIGMTEAELEEALKPFGQVKSAYTRNHEGAGLGLPIAKALVEEHSGKFYISSAPNIGTHVTFSLPRSRGNGEGEENRRDQPPQEGTLR